MTTVPESQGRIIIISGPSGVGKGTLLRRVFAESGLPLQMSVSATTRAARPGEVEGQHYRFLSAAEFERRRTAGEFLECFEVFSQGTWYGTLKSDVEKGLAEKKWIVLEIDVKGARQVKQHFPKARSIFVKPKNVDVLQKRLRGRGTDTNEAMEQRLSTALQEMEYAGEFDFRVVNDDLDVATRELIAILESQLKD